MNPGIISEGISILPLSRGNLTHCVVVFFVSKEKILMSESMFCELISLVGKRIGRVSCWIEALSVPGERNGKEPE